MGATGYSVKKPAVVLLSGGLDSATTLAWAGAADFACYALSVAYGQRHASELEAAARVARALGALEHRTMRVDLAGIGGSALTDSHVAVPEVPTVGIPSTYVPARNTLLLALALGWAEVLQSRDIFIGVNAVDFSGYPDCRAEFINAFEKMAALATRAGVEGHPCRVHTPLISWTKAQIIHEGLRLGVNFGATVSCYQADALGRACGRCDSCRIRKLGFEVADVPDPTRYQPV
jgi:7-cyano-7-deazaguanine synthase